MTYNKKNQNKRLKKWDSPRLKVLNTNLTKSGGEPDFYEGAYYSE